MSDAVPTPPPASPDPSSTAPASSTPAEAPSAPSRGIEELRAVAAQAAGLRPELAARVTGASLSEMVADARELAKLMAPSAPAAPAAPATPQLDPRDGFDGGTRREPPNGGTSREYVGNLAKTNPAEFNRQVESGQLDLSKVR
jgi:hypothetical protein